MAREANALFERASERAASATQWSVELWRADMLASPKMAQEARHDTRDADVILLAFRDQTELSPALLTWLEEWAQCRWVMDAALAVFEGNREDKLSASPLPTLCELAERHGLFLISGDVMPWRAEQPEFFMAKVQESAVAQTDIMAGILREDSRHSFYRHWGINE